ncbi:MAG TPA: hypothetical protein VFM07_03695 [Intrasporangium sp.]|nr:hypothetical protein [Intrasporangium sp.]
MNWDVAQAPAVDHQAQEPDAHEVVVPAEEQDERHSWVDLDRGVVHLALPPERFGSAWEAEPELDEQH